MYRAHDTKLGRDVAIKVLPSAFTTDPSRLAGFEREARVVASLNHPHIAAIHGVEESEGVRGLVLELVEGETLAERLERAGRTSRSTFPIQEVLDYARQIADALEAAHEKGITHRDLKPANVKITPDGVVKLLDFGIAKVVTGDGPGVDLTHAPTTLDATRSGLIVGTAGYMSPEQARGRPEAPGSAKILRILMILKTRAAWRPPRRTSAFQAGIDGRPSTLRTNVDVFWHSPIWVDQNTSGRLAMGEAQGCLPFVNLKYVPHWRVARG